MAGGKNSRRPRAQDRNPDAQRMIWPASRSAGADSLQGQAGRVAVTRDYTGEVGV